MIRVGVVRGGVSDEFEVSIKTGASVLAALPKDKYVGIDILLSKDGEWHVEGVPKNIRQMRANVDVVFNALHGEFGEDGKASRLFETHDIPYTGSNTLPSALAMNKPLAKEAFRRAGIRVPPGMTIEDYRDSTIVGEIPEKIQELAHKIFRNIPSPWVLKPARGGSSINTYVAKNWGELVHALSQLFSYGGDIVAEQYIRGKEATVGVIRDFRNKKLYPLMPVEIRAKGNDFFDYVSKYSGHADEAVPGSFSPKEKEELERHAMEAHEALGLNDYSRSDFIVTPRGHIYILEINNLPGLCEASLFPKALHAVGSNLPEFVDHLITLAMQRK